MHCNPMQPSSLDATHALCRERYGALLRAAVENERLGTAFEHLKTGDGVAVPSTDAACDSDARTTHGNKMGKEGRTKQKAGTV